MGNFSSKDNHGLSGPHLDISHTPPASPLAEDPCPKPSVPQLHPSPSPKASPPSPGSSPTPVPGPTSQPPATLNTSPIPPATQIVPVHDKPDRDEQEDPEENVPSSLTPEPPVSPLVSPAVHVPKSQSEEATSSPLVGSDSDQKCQDDRLGTSAPVGLKVEDGEEMEKLLDECLVTLHDEPKEDATRNVTDILRQLRCEVINLRTRMRTEQTEWLQFQNDFQVAVAVADRLRAEAEEEILVLRATHEDTENELEDARRRQKESDAQLVKLRDELKASQQKLAHLTLERDRPNREENNNNNDDDDQAANQKGRERLDCSGTSLNDGKKIEDNKGVTKLYLRNLANKDKSAEITRTTVSERSRSLSRSSSSPPEPLTVQNGSQSTSSESNKSGNDIRVGRGLNDQESRSNANTGKESLKRYNPTSAELPANISQDGFNTLLHRHGGSKRNWMLRWCQSRTQGYKNIEITNFSSSWVDGLAFCALYHTYLPSRIPYSSLSPDNKRENLSLAFRTGLAVGVSPSLTAEEMLRSGGPDWQRVLGYVEAMYRFLESVR